MANVDLKEMARERKREEKSTKCPKCPTVPLYQISNKNCNKKDNILIYNDLDKIHNSIWDSGTPDFITFLRHHIAQIENQ